MWFVNYQEKVNNRRFLFLILFLLSTTLISLRTLKEVNIQHIRISGSELFTQNDLIKNLSLKFPIRLIFIQTKFLEEELKQNLSLRDVSVSRQLFPFGLQIKIYTRLPIAYVERISNGKKILGFVDKDGIFIQKQNAENINLSKLTINVFGWKEKYKKVLSEILISQENHEFEIIEITFSPNGFLTIKEKDLKTIFLGFNHNLINYQLKIINKFKNEFKKNNFSEKIDNIDLTDPNKPKIKVFKP